jgi:hypothetical protein
LASNQYMEWQLRQWAVTIASWLLQCQCQVTIQIRYNMTKTFFKIEKSTELRCDNIIFF